MTKIKELIREPLSNSEPQTDLIVDGEISIQEAVQQMLSKCSESVAVQVAGQEGYATLSREHLLQRLLHEMDQIQRKVSELQLQLESQLSDQIELMEVGAACIAENEKKKLRSAVKSLSEGMILMNAAGQIEQANEAVRQILDLTNMDDLSVVNNAIEKLGFRELMKVSESVDERSHGEFRVKSGAGRLLLVRWSRMADEWGHCLGRALSIRDITDQIAAENTKNDFITAISHELRTPLTSIQNSVSNILAGVTGKVATKTRKYLETMKGDCHRFADLINDLLDMAKLEAGNMPVSKRVMSLETLVRNTIRDFEYEAQQAGIMLKSDIPELITPVYADIKRIRQVLMNLVRNAIQFTPSGGQVHVRVYENNGDIVTCVKDTGVGISQDLQKLIFTKFYQIARQAGPGSKGSGLGLAISRGILLVHGGSIWLESEPGQGSAFYFSLPKMNPDGVLRKHLDLLIDTASTASSQFGVIVLRFGENGESSDSQSVSDATGYMISELLAQSRFLLSNEMDLALQTGDREVTFVVNQHGRQDLETVRMRLEKIVQNWIKKTFSGLSILPMMAVMEYSEEITNSEELLEQVSSLPEHQFAR